MKRFSNLGQVNIFIILISFVIGVFGTLLAAGDVAAKPVKIRLAHGVPPTDISAIIFHNKAQLKHYGDSYVVEATRFRSPPATFPALAAKELEMTYMSFPALASLVTRAKLDVKIIADISGYAPGYGSHAWAVREDSPIRRIEDLKGKSIGTNSVGTAIDFSARNKLRQHGLKYPGDFRFVEIRFPHQEAMLREGKIDMAVLLIPFWHRAKRKGGVRRLFTSLDGTGRAQILSLVARTDFLRDHPKVMQDFMDDWVRSLRWFLNPKNRDAAIKLTSSITKVPAKAYKAWAFSKGDVYRDADGFPDLVALQKNLDDLYRLKMIPRMIDVTKHIDFSFLRNARTKK